MPLFRIMLATIALCFAFPALTQGQKQQVALDTAAVANLKGHWTGTASGNTGSIPVELVLDDVQVGGNVLGSMVFPQTPRGRYVFTFGASVDRTKQIGTAVFDGRALKIVTPLKTSYTLALTGSKLEGPYVGDNIQTGSGRAMLTK